MEIKIQIDGMDRIAELLERLLERPQEQPAKVLPPTTPKRAKAAKEEPEDDFVDEAEQGPVYTLDDVRKKLIEVRKAKGSTFARAILEKLGVANVSKLEAPQYLDAIDQANTILGVKE